LWIRASGFLRGLIVLPCLEYDRSYRLISMLKICPCIDNNSLVIPTNLLEMQLSCVSCLRSRCPVNLNSDQSKRPQQCEKDTLITHSPPLTTNNYLSRSRKYTWQSKSNSAGVFSVNFWAQFDPTLNRRPVLTQYTY